MNYFLFSTNLPYPLLHDLLYGVYLYDNSVLPAYYLNVSAVYMVTESHMNMNSQTIILDFCKSIYALHLFCAQFKTCF